MIAPGRPLASDSVARHYDELDFFYRTAWGEDLHHGLWTRGDETAEEAVRALTTLVAERAAVVPGSRVCDVGCGYGGTARLLADRYRCRVTGVTISEAQYRRACATPVACANASVAPAASCPPPNGDSGRTQYLLSDWLDAPIDPASFDAVVAIESLSHMQDKPASIAKAQGALRPGGRMVVAAWMAAPNVAGWRRRHLLEPICTEGRLPGLATENDYLGWFENAGFERVEVQDLSASVARTWAVCLGRLVRLLVGSPEARRYLRNPSRSERSFAITVGRMWLGYRTGALRYGLFTSRRPGDGLHGL